MYTYSKIVHCIQMYMCSDWSFFEKNHKICGLKFDDRMAWLDNVGVQCTAMKLILDKFYNCRAGAYHTTNFEHEFCPCIRKIIQTEYCTIIKLLSTNFVFEKQEIRTLHKMNSILRQMNGLNKNWAVVQNRTSLYSILM